MYPSHTRFSIPPRGTCGSHSRICSPVLELSPVLAAARIPCILQLKCRGVQYGQWVSERRVQDLTRGSKAAWRASLSNTGQSREQCNRQTSIPASVSSSHLLPVNAVSGRRESCSTT